MDTVCEKAKGSHLMGWCTTGQHDKCRISFIDWNGNTVRCGCLKHPEPEKDPS